MTSARSGISSHYVPVQGSNAWISPKVKSLMGAVPAWWQADSPLDLFLRERGIAHLNDENPYLWTTALGGMEWFWRLLRRAPHYPDHRDWQNAGWQLKLYFELAKIPVEQRVVLAYSHAIQPALYACAYGLEIDRLLTFGGPIRADMRDIAETARRRIGRWVSVADPGDVIQHGGQWFDGAVVVAWNQCHPLADTKDLIHGIGHGRVLQDPAFFHYWDDRQWAQFLQTHS